MDKKFLHQPELRKYRIFLLLVKINDKIKKPKQSLKIVRFRHWPHRNFKATKY